MYAWNLLARWCAVIKGEKDDNKDAKWIAVVKKHALIAIARKILVAIYHMLSSNTQWNPTDLASVETSVTDRIKYTKNNLNQSVKQLLSLGLTSDELITLIKQNANTI